MVYPYLHFQKFRTTVLNFIVHLFLTWLCKNTRPKNTARYNSFFSFLSMKVCRAWINHWKARRKSSVILTATSCGWGTASLHSVSRTRSPQLSWLGLGQCQAFHYQNGLTSTLHSNIKCKFPSSSAWHILQDAHCCCSEYDSLFWTTIRTCLRFPIRFISKQHIHDFFQKISLCFAAFVLQFAEEK